jgi:hypothetical protein
MNLLFRLSNLVVLPFWALMMFLPRWRWTARIMRSPFVSAVLAAFYAALVVRRISGIWPAVARPTLSGVANLLGSPRAQPSPGFISSPLTCLSEVGSISTATSGDSVNG